MIEIGEAKWIKDQMCDLLSGLKIIKVSMMNREHKFCFLNHTTYDFEMVLQNKTIQSVKQNGHMIRLLLDYGRELVFFEDFIFEYKTIENVTDKNQMVIYFNNEMALEIKVKLYGFIMVGTRSELEENDVYFKRALSVIDPLDVDFTYEYFIQETKLNEPKHTVKMALATEQKIPGLGNGTLQDILFYAKVRPDRKVETLKDFEKIALYQETKRVIGLIYQHKGRHLQSDILLNKGKYEVQMCSTRGFCPNCQTNLNEKNYLGGKVIFCPHCQK